MSFLSLKKKDNTNSKQSFFFFFFFLPCVLNPPRADTQSDCIESLSFRMRLCHVCSPEKCYTFWIKLPYINAPYHLLHFFILCGMYPHFVFLLPLKEKIYFPCIFLPSFPNPSFLPYFKLRPLASPPSIHIPLAVSF